MPPKDKEASAGVAKKLQEEFMPHPKHFASARKGHARKKGIDATDTNVFCFLLTISSHSRHSLKRQSFGPLIATK